jgi:hypothetical protein
MGHRKSEQLARWARYVAVWHAANVTSELAELRRLVNVDALSADARADAARGGRSERHMARLALKSSRARRARKQTS